MAAIDLVDVVIVWRRIGPDGEWTVGPVLYRDGMGAVHRHPRGADAVVAGASTEQEFACLWDADPVLDRSGYDLERHRRIRASELDALVESRVREKAAAPAAGGGAPGRGSAPAPCGLSHDGLAADADQVADCFTLSRAWAIAAELVHRHPGLRISRVVDEEQNPLLLVHDESEATQIQFDLPYSVHYVSGDDVRCLSWAEVFATRPAAVVEHLERAVGLGLPAPSLRPEPRALVYRVVASVLALGLDDDATWQAVHAHIHPAEIDVDTFLRFPGGMDTAWRYLEEIRTRVALEGRIVFHQPVWALLRDVETVALLDTAGRVHLPEGTIDLLAFHERHGRRLARTVAGLLGDVLS